MATIRMFSIAVIVCGALGGLSRVPAAHAAQTLVVQTTTDPALCPSTPGSELPLSLRCALMQANQDNGGDTINFAIANDGVNACSGVPVRCTITPTSALPAMKAGSTIVDGYTQYGASANGQLSGDNAVITVLLDGVSAPSGVTGLTVQSAANTIRGLQIVRFKGNGIQIALAAATANSITGNFLGTDGTTSVALGNTGCGIQVTSGASMDTIGGTAVGLRNLIAGNGQDGICLDGSANQIVVLGNYVGLDRAGGAAVPNLGNGITVTAPSNANTIGGTNDGSRNVVSGNSFIGIFVKNVGADNNVVEGNFVGVNATGNAAVPNGWSGIAVENGATGNTIGGTTPGAGNVASGNTLYDGIAMAYGVHGNVVQGNFVGTDVTGTIAIPNGSNGITIFGGSHNNTIGGTQVGSGNLVSGNTGGIWMNDVGTTLNQIQGNSIGTNAAHSAALPNQNYGIFIGNVVTRTTIGGTASGAGNLISGNGIVGSASRAPGVEINGNGTNANLVEGNRIGTNPAGTASLPNTGNGVLVEDGARGNTVGGVAPGAGNVLSGNGDNGVAMWGAKSTLVQGNLIGTNVNGTAAIGNVTAGVDFETGNANVSADNNTVGGTTAAARNIISGNGDGVDLGRSNNNVIEGNYIGTDIYGTAAIGNLFLGINMYDYATATDTQNNIVGGTVLGSGNVISGNHRSGIDLTSVSGTLIEGNSIGLDSAGHALGNGARGIRATGASTGTIGGIGSATNTIAYNAKSGVEVGASVSDATHMSIRHNLIHDNVASGAGTPPTAAEIYLFGQSPLACTSPSVTSTPNEYLPCPQILSSSGGTVTVKTCSGCVVELFEAHPTPNDQNAGGSIAFLASATDSGVPCTVPCANTTNVQFKGIPSNIQLTATATRNDGTETSEFAQNSATATGAVVNRFSAHRRGTVVNFRWQVAAGQGISGFNLYAGRYRLNRQTIATHPETTYQYRLVWRGGGSYRLQALLRSGGMVMIPAQ